MNLCLIFSRLEDWVLMMELNNKDLRLLVYCSEYTGQMEDSQNTVSTICAQAKENNPRLGVSGVLFFHDGLFLQLIEGKSQNIEELMSAISKDSRHRNIDILVDHPIKERFFSQWNMDYFNLTDADKLNIGDLRLVSEIFKRNLVVKSDLLLSFYKKNLLPEKLAALRT